MNHVEEGGLVGQTARPKQSSTWTRSRIAGSAVGRRPWRWGVLSGRPEDKWKDSKVQTARSAVGDSSKAQCQAASVVCRRVVTVGVR